jgi:hypothetical protein
MGFAMGRTSIQEVLPNSKHSIVSEIILYWNRPEGTQSLGAKVKEDEMFRVCVLNVKGEINLKLLYYSKSNYMDLSNVSKKKNIIYLPPKTSHFRNSKQIFELTVPIILYSIFYSWN